MDGCIIKPIQNRDKSSSPVPEFDVDQMRAFRSFENLLNELDENDGSMHTSCTIIPATPVNSQGSVSPTIELISVNQTLLNKAQQHDCSMRSPCTIIPPTPENNQNSVSPTMKLIRENEDFDSRESSVLDSDADPEYFPPDPERMIDVLRNDVPGCSKTLTSKRLRCPEEWKKNVRTVKSQRGDQFTDSLGINRKRREIKMGCGEACAYGCHEEFNLSERTFIFDNFWQLSSKSKGEFFGNLVFKVPVERSRTTNNNSRRKNTFIYYFLKAGKLKRVCQLFFTSTLDINKTRIHYYFPHLIDPNTTTSKSPAKGRHKKNELPPNKLDEVASHISGFATMDSHYCRSSSTKKYLEPHLSIRKMYELYCNEIEDPIKFWAYKHIFETKFNLAFFVPKKDLCNKCEEHKTKVNNGEILSEAEQNEFSNHMQNKLAAKAEKDVDRTNCEPNTRILVVDLQNVYALPKANINCFYYKRKLLCFNLTGYCQDNRTTYCSFWNETMQGRGGNELASAFVKILQAVMSDFPQTERIIIWTDSCVPQNRNSIVSLSFLKFMKENPHVKLIEQTFSEPGHSMLQEVDAVHSTLEKYLRNMEIFSPIGLVRLLSNAISFPK